MDNPPIFQYFYSKIFPFVLLSIVYNSKNLQNFIGFFMDLYYFLSPFYMADGCSVHMPLFHLVSLTIWL